MPFCLLHFQQLSHFYPLILPYHYRNKYFYIVYKIFSYRPLHLNFCLFSSFSVSFLVDGFICSPFTIASDNTSFFSLSSTTLDSDSFPIVVVSSINSSFTGFKDVWSDCTSSIVAFSASVIILSSSSLPSVIHIYIHKVKLYICIKFNIWQFHQVFATINRNCSLLQLETNTTIKLQPVFTAKQPTELTIHK